MVAGAALALSFAATHVLLVGAERNETVRVAVVTGANRGIGFATVKRLCRTFDGVVLLTARNYGKCCAAARLAGRTGPAPALYPVDLSNHATCLAFRNHVKATYGGLDVLVNNAGVRYADDSPVNFAKRACNTLATNFYDTLFLCQLLFPLLRPHARVVNLSAPGGRLASVPSQRLRTRFAEQTRTIPALVGLVNDFRDSVIASLNVEEGWGIDAYAVSKLAVTVMTTILQRMVSEDRPSDGILVNCYSPGTVRTRLSGHSGHLTPAMAAENVVRLATLPPGATGPAGQLVWDDYRVVDWKGKTRLRDV